MTDAVRFPLVLGLIATCSAAGLAITYEATAEAIRRQKELKRARALAATLGLDLDESAQAERPWTEVRYPGLQGERPEPFAVYAATDPQTGRPLYAAEGKAQGYSSKVHVVVAARQEPGHSADGLTLQAIRVVNQRETPGLGTRCTEREFQHQFRDLPAALLDLVTNADYRDPEAPDSSQRRPAAISGATITSNAVVAAIGQALDRIRHHLAQGAGGAPRP